MTLIESLFIFLSSHTMGYDDEDDESPSAGFATMLMMRLRRKVVKFISNGVEIGRRTESE